MDQLSSTVLGLGILLALAVLMLPVARRLHIPFTVFLALVGGVLGGMELVFPASPGAGPFNDFLHFLQEFHLTSEAVFFIFLPALIFESALSINVHRLLDDLIPILILAIVGLLVSTFIVGLSMVTVSDKDLLVCMLLGAIVSATDPVAVVALFKELQAPKRLTILVEGESLFNDATAIVMFTILTGMILQQSEPGIAAGIGSFLKVFVGGVLTGYVCGRIVCGVFGQIQKVPIIKITLSICVAYFSFIIAEHYLHVSGVMAVVTAGLVVGSLGPSVMSPPTWHSLQETWDHLGFWANAVIFILVGIAVPKILMSMTGTEVGLLGIMILSAFVARGVILYGILPGFTFGNWVAKVSMAYKTVMFWGGLRGAVSLALALAVMENPAFSEDTRHFVGVMVTGLVLFTLFVNATTIGAVMRFFGLDRLSLADQAVRQAAIKVSLNDISKYLEHCAEELEVSPELTREMLDRYHHRIDALNSQQEQTRQIPRADWLRIGLTTLTHEERAGYLQHFGDGFVDSKIARVLLAQTEDLIDGIRLDAVQGYEAAWNKHLGFNWRFSMGSKIQTWTGYCGVLAELLADRFEILISQRKSVRALLATEIKTVTQLLGEETGGELTGLLASRLAVIEKALTMLKLQYPDYTRTLEKRYLSQVALRLESTEFEDMAQHYIISEEVFQDLWRELESSTRRISKRPKLDLGLQPEKLVARVPLFADCPPGRIAHIAKLLHPKLALPGEKIIRKGEPGHTMYFISSGSVEVAGNGESILLGTNDFFGEIALLQDIPRTADVTAHGFCNLLVLDVKDFRDLLATTPDLKEAIERTAQQRYNKSGQRPE